MPRSISATEREREVREVGRSSHTHVELNVTGEVGGRSSHPDRISSERERWRETGRQAEAHREKGGWGGGERKAHRERVRKRNRGHKCIIQ